MVCLNSLVQGCFNSDAFQSSWLPSGRYRRMMIGICKNDAEIAGLKQRLDGVEADGCSDDRINLQSFDHFIKNYLPFGR